LIISVNPFGARHRTDGQPDYPPSPAGVLPLTRGHVFDDPGAHASGGLLGFGLLDDGDLHGYLLKKIRTFR
jgi:hypothetical protein